MYNEITLLVPKPFQCCALLLATTALSWLTIAVLKHSGLFAAPFDPDVPLLTPYLKSEPDMSAALGERIAIACGKRPPPVAVRYVDFVKKHFHNFAPILDDHGGAFNPYREKPIEPPGISIPRDRPPVPPFNPPLTPTPIL
jgi:hypothetical protein